MTDQDDVARDLVQRAHVQETRPPFDVVAGLHDVFARAARSGQQLRVEPDNETSPARLYGRDSAIELVLEFLVRPERKGVPRSRRTPVLVFTGPPGIGKTALVIELIRRMDRRVPVAQIDCKTIDAASTREMLSTLAFEFNRQYGKHGRLPLPRFITGQLAIAQKLDMTDHGRARQQVGQVLEEYQKSSKMREFLADNEPAVISAVPSALPIPGVSAAGRYLPNHILNGLTSRWWGRRVALKEACSWYGHQDRGFFREPIDVLVDLNRKANCPDIAGNEREVGELLWAAFLADLRKAYRKRWRAKERTLNCLVLVDNIDTTISRNFLDELISARRQHAEYTPDDPDPLTVVATSYGASFAHVTAPGEFVPSVENASYADYLDRGDDQREHAWYPVMLRDLTLVEVSKMVSTLGLYRANNRHIATAVDRFTGGHPRSTRLMLDAIAKRPTDAVDLRAVLDAVEPGFLEPASTTVQQRLLYQFLQDVPEDAVDDLVTCSAARDIDQASRFVFGSGLLTAPQGARPVLFAPQLWTPPYAAGTSVMRPVLRRLLLRLLAARTPDQPTSWSGVHNWFRQDCSQTGDEAGELHHLLALGDVEYVTRRLAKLLPHTDVDVWLRLLWSATAAPNRLSHPLVSIDQVRVLTRWADPYDLPLAPLARLVAALWIDSDPLGNHNARRSLYLQIAADFREIASYVESGLVRLRVEAETYYRSAQLWD